MIDGKKIAAIYNVWDGEELLAGSIAQIRPFVDYVVGLVQTRSNIGELYRGGIDEMDRLYSEGIINGYRHFDPLSGVHPSQNERAKRQDLIDGIKCHDIDIIIQLDCDEYYQPHQFEKALKRFIASGMDGSFCKLRTFYKEPTLQLLPTEEYYVPLFHRLTPETKTGVKYPVLVDPTRGLSGKTFLEFSRSEIEMYHYSFIRNDIGRKLRNSSARKNFERDMEKHINQWENAKEGNKIDYFGHDKQLVRVPNYFNIQI